jgi:hypothetical protein
MLYADKMCFVLYVNIICSIVHLEVAVELVKPLVCTRDVPISNLGSATLYPDSRSIHFLSLSRHVLE